MKKYSTTEINNLTFEDAYEYLKNAYTRLDNMVAATIRANIDGSHTLEVLVECEDTPLPNFEEEDEDIFNCYCDTYGHCACSSCPHYAECEGW